MRINRLSKWLVLTILLYVFSSSVSAAPEPPLRPDNFTANYPVYNSTTGEYTITLNWSASVGADFYIIEIATDENWAGQTITEEKKTSALTYDDLRQNSVSSPTSGTIFRYKLYAATYILDGSGNPTSDYVKSTTYASVTVLTDPAVSATALSTTEVKLTWDDIKYEGESIDYEIIKYKKSIKVGQDQIRAADIGTTAKRVNGKLEYTVGNLDKSTEYTFRLVPILDTNLVKFNPFVEVAGATKISAFLQRYNESIMKLVWDEYQGSIASADLYYKVIEITENNNQKTYRVIATPEVPYYFIQVKSDIEPSYLIEVRKKDDDTKVAESAEVSLKDILVPATPPIPQLECTVENNNITVSWNVDKTINGDRDTSMKYDFWLLDDPEQIDSIRNYYTPNNGGIEDNRIGTDLQVINGVSSNPSFSLARVNGQDKYRFSITNLQSNTTYYIGVVSKKTYLLQDPDNQEMIISLTYNSDPAVETIKTTSGNLQQPVALVQPLGVSVKNDNQGKALVTEDSITIEWPLGQTINNVFTSLYEDDVYFRVGFEVHTQTFDKSKINDPNNVNYNIKLTSVTITRETETAYANITGLASNIPYVFWVKAYRDIPGTIVITKVSEASDPIIVATLPNYTTPDAKPPVPAVTVEDNEYSDKITVKFNSMADMTYTIAWGTEDNVAKKTGQKEYTPLSSSSPDSIIIDGLKPETTYFFWIKAANGALSSEWSDSAVGKTIPIPPPDVPQGFGVKKITVNGEVVPDIGEHHINLQWDKVNGIVYTIEVSKKEDFSESEKVDVDNVSEYKLEKFDGKELQSNTRYWIRIFAKDEVNEKISDNSPYLTVKTNYNYDEYNSSQDDETVIEEKVKKETIDGTKGVWDVNITGESTDKLVEKIKNQDVPDYSLDLRQTSVAGVKKREITVSHKILEVLSQTNQNFIVKSNSAEFIFLPNVLDLKINNKLNSFSDDLSVKIIINTTAPSANDSTNKYVMLSDINQLEVYIVSGDESQVVNFDKPIKIKLNYVNNNKSGIIDSYYIPTGSTEWVKVQNSKEVMDNKQYLVLYNDKTGKYAVRKQLPDTRQLGATIYKNEIQELLSTGLIKSIDPNNIKPTQPVILEDAVKILLDSIKVEYKENYIDIAKKSGILSLLYDLEPTRVISKEEAVSMAMRMYEVKTGISLPDGSVSSNYKDADSIDYIYLNYISSALKMNILTVKGGYIRPKNNMTRGEMLAVTNRLVQILENTKER